MRPINCIFKSYMLESKSKKDKIEEIKIMKYYVVYTISEVGKWSIFGCYERREDAFAESCMLKFRAGIAYSDYVAVPFKKTSLSVQKPVEKIRRKKVGLPKW